MNRKVIFLVILILISSCTFPIDFSQLSIDNPFEMPPPPKQEDVEVFEVYTSERFLSEVLPFLAIDEACWDRISKGEENKYLAILVERLIEHIRNFENRKKVIYGDEFSYQLDYAYFSNFEELGEENEDLRQAVLTYLVYNIKGSFDKALGVPEQDRIDLLVYLMETDIDLDEVSNQEECQGNHPFAKDPLVAEQMENLPVTAPIVYKPEPITEGNINPSSFYGLLELYGINPDCESHIRIKWYGEDNDVIDQVFNFLVDFLYNKFSDSNYAAAVQELYRTRIGEGPEKIPFEDMTMDLKRFYIDTLRSTTENLIYEFEQGSPEYNYMMSIINDLDGDGLSNSGECGCLTDPFDADTDDDGFTDTCENQEAFVELLPKPSEELSEEPPFDYKEWLKEETACPEVINYALCGSDGCVTNFKQLDQSSGGYLTCKYSSGAGNWYPVEECNTEKSIGMSCYKFVSSAFRYGLPEDKKLFDDHLIWGNGYDIFDRDGTVKYTGVCGDDKPESKDFMVPELVFDFRVEETGIFQDISTLRPGDIASAIGKNWETDPLLTVNGHAALYIGRGKLERSSEKYLDKFSNKFQKFGDICFDKFNPDPEGDYIFMSALPVEVCFSTYEGLFGEEGIYDLKKVCRPKYCDKNFNLAYNMPIAN